MNEGNPYADPEASDPEVGVVTIPPTTGKLAIASLVSGLVFCCPVASLLAPVLGIAHFIAAAGKPWVRGGGLAIGGILLGVIFTAGWAFIAWSGYSVFRQATEISQQVMADLDAGDLEAAKARFLGDGVTTEELSAGFSAVTDRYGTFESMRFDEAAEAPPSGNTIELPFVATFDRDGETREVPVRVSLMPRPGTLDIRIVEIEFGDEDESPLLIPPGGQAIEDLAPTPAGGGGADGP